jgi:hypothetical protein
MHLYLYCLISCQVKGDIILGIGSAVKVKVGGLENIVVAFQTANCKGRSHSP